MLLLLGPTDSGKTTLAGRLLQKVGEAYLLDLDPGQGALPGSFTLFRFREGVLTPVRRALVGAPSPAGVEARTLVAGLRLARLIPPGSPVVADTDGLLDPEYRLLQVEALNPTEVVVLGAEGLYRALAWRRDLRVRLLPPLPEARRKTPAERRRKRLERLLAHFQGAGPRLAPSRAPLPGEALRPPGPRGVPPGLREAPRLWGRGGPLPHPGQGGGGQGPPHPASPPYPRTTRLRIFPGT